MSEPALERTPEEHAALAAMADALGRFAHAIEACEQVGIPLADALELCGIPLPSWAKPFVGQAHALLPVENIRE